MTRSLLILAIAGSLNAGWFSTAQGIVSIGANAPAFYEAVTHPVRSAKKVGGATVSVAKRVAHPKKGKRT